MRWYKYIYDKENLSQKCETRIINLVRQIKWNLVSVVNWLLSWTYNLQSNNAVEEELVVIKDNQNDPDHDIDQAIHNETV